MGVSEKCGVEVRERRCREKMTGRKWRRGKEGGQVWEEAGVMMWISMGSIWFGESMYNSVDNENVEVGATWRARERKAQQTRTRCK